MSTFLRSLLGALRSNTMQTNVGSLLFLVLTSIFNSDLIQSNPEYVTIGAGVLAAINILLRVKTEKSLLTR